MRQRERIVRIAVQTAEQLGLDPKDKTALESIFSNPAEAIRSAGKKDDKEKREKSDVAQEEIPQDPVVQKKKNPFPPKKKKTLEESSEEAEATPSTDE